MNEQDKYVVCESTDYGCKVYNVVNTETGNRINYYPDYKSAKEFAERQNRIKMNETLEQQVKRLEFCRDCIVLDYDAGREEYNRLERMIEELKQLTSKLKSAKR